MYTVWVYNQGTTPRLPKFYLSHNLIAELNSILFAKVELLKHLNKIRLQFIFLNLQVFVCQLFSALP